MDVLNKCQFGFRKNKNTSQAAFRIMSQAAFRIMTYLLKAIDNTEITHVVYIDCQEAFNTIDLTILIQKLYKYYNMCNTPL